MRSQDGSPRYPLPKSLPSGEGLGVRRRRSPAGSVGLSASRLFLCISQQTLFNRLIVSLHSGDTVMMVFFKRIGVFLLVFIVLDITWTLCSSLWLFPNDIIGVGIETPLPNNHTVMLINQYDYGDIVNNENMTIISSVDSLQIVEDFVIGRNTKSYFSLNTLTDEVSLYDSIPQLKASLDCDFQLLTTPYDYYWAHRKPFDIAADIIMVILSLLLALFLTRKLH